MNKRDTNLNPSDHTADEWRAMAAKCQRDARASFERCDTDGFLSQWADSITAQQYLAAADLADKGGVTEFDALTDLEGNLLDAREVEGRYGWSWLIREVDGSTRFYNPSRSCKGATCIAHATRAGVRMVRVTKRALVGLSGNGMAGLTPYYLPADDEVLAVRVVTAAELDY